MRLSPATLSSLSDTVSRPGYDWLGQAAGIVHLGIGAFHRAHQAVYTDGAMAAGDRDWRIRGVSLRSAGVARQLNPQGGLYTVTTRSTAIEARRLVGAVADVIVASADRAAAVAAIAAPGTRIVSLTVTEKGYGRGADGTLDPAALVDTPGAPTIHALLRDGLAARRVAGLPGLTLLSCDNLADNGAVLSRLLADYLERHDPALARWTAAECAFPGTMVDRIVPAVSDVDRTRIAAAIGLRDEGAVMAEPFSQWVIEDRFAGARPRWDLAGARFVGNVRAYETAKLRMLNGAHSALAYLGLAAGHRFVHQAVADPALRATVAALMAEAAASLVPVPGLDLDAYAAALLERFGNAALPHRLAQIAMDGSQKIPQRWLAPLAANRRAGRASPATLTALAAWIAFVRGDRHPVEDPRAQELAALWMRAGATGIASALFGPGGLLAAEWTAEPDDLTALGNRLIRTA